MEEKRPKQMSVAEMLRSINSYKGENTKLRNRIKELRAERNKFEQMYISADTDLQYYLALPWYKRIFAK